MRKRLFKWMVVRKTKIKEIALFHNFLIMATELSDWFLHSRDLGSYPFCAVLLKISCKVCRANPVLYRKIMALLNRDLNNIKAHLNLVL